MAQQFWQWNRTRWLPTTGVPNGGIPPGVATATTVVDAVAPIASWLEELTVHGPPWQRAGAVLALGAAGRVHAHPGLPGWLQDADPGVRAATVHALGCDGSLRARQALMAVLAAAPPAGEVDLRPLAAVALAAAVAAPSPPHVAFALRAELERGAEPELRAALLLAGARAAVDALGPFAWQEAVAGTHDSVVAPALAVLRPAQVPPGSDVLAALVARGRTPGLAACGGLAAHAGADGLRLLAAALQQAGREELRRGLLFAAVAHPDAAPLLLERLQRGPQADRGSAALALACHARCFGHALARAPVLASRRDNRSDEQVGEWLLAQALVGDPAVVAMARQRLDRRGDEANCVLAIDALTLVGDAPAVDALWWAAANREEPAVAAVALDGLARLQPDALVAHGRVAGEGAELAAARCLALGRTRQPKAAALLHALVGDARAEPSLRRAALLGLAQAMRVRGPASPYDGYGQGVAFLWLPAWLQAVVRALA